MRISREKISIILAEFVPTYEAAYGCRKDVVI